MDVKAYQHGIYPRSEALVQATRDVDRGRVTQASVDAAFEQDRAAFLDVQRDAGLDYLSDGLLRWQDLFRALVESSEGLDAQVLVRWFNNNSFYRAPAPTERPRFRALPGWVAQNGIPEPRVASLPSPYLFSRAAQFEGDRNELMKTVTGAILGPAVTDLRRNGYDLIHLEEPWLGYHGIEEESWAPFEAAISALRAAAGDATLILHVYYGDASPYADRLIGLPVDAIGIDFDETDADDLPAPWGTGLLAGVFDGRRSVTEASGDVSEFVAGVVERLQPTALFLSSGSDLELAGPQVAPDKVRALGRAATMLKEML